MKKIFVIAFWASITCIVLGFALLLIFKLLHITSQAAAYSVAGLMLVGGLFLILTSVLLLFRKDLANVWAEKLLFHFPEFIALGAISLVLAVVLFLGKELR